MASFLTENLDASVPHETEVLSGDIAEEILAYVSKASVDMIIMGTHERGLSHTFLGSVAKSVLRRSHVPSLVVPLGEAD